ncbi:MAG: 3-phosphoglycerate dehydrogenase [Oscillospiraceae bacterium]|nr:3-phosphoglycerate dehydrogenase [Oscillospiraceae bacterium]
MYQILTKNNISKVGLAGLPESTYTVSDACANPSGILVRSANLIEEQFNPELLCIARAGAGVNNIPVDRCAEEGIVVFNTPGANANAVKELVLCALFLASRKIGAAMTWTQSLKGKGDEIPKLAEKGKSNFAGPEIKGKKLGVIGLGAIGVMVANTALHLGMEVFGYDPYLSVDVAWEISRKIHHAQELETIFKECDYITVHVPATDETRGMFGAKNFAIMKDGVRIINFARGELANAADVIQALESGKVAAYVTDFAEEALLGVEGVTVLPHLGASTPESEDNCAKMAVEEMRNYLECGIIKNSVNFPNMLQPKSTAYRVCVLHKNVPKMVSSVTAIFADADINIEQLSNASKRNNACTFVDVDVEPTDDLLAKINAIADVYRVHLVK